jgi:membrane-associated phospholipid phosphatase
MAFKRIKMKVKLSFLGIMGFKCAIIFLIIGFLFIHTGCDKVLTEQKTENSLIDFLNDFLNEALIQDGFSPPVASKIYAYCNLAAFEAYQISDSNKIDFSSFINEYNLQFEPPKEKVNKELVIISAFCHIAKDQVYRDFIIDSLFAESVQLFAKNLSKKVSDASIAVGQNIANEIIEYSKGDNYLKSRSYPLYKLLGTPGSWEPTPPYFGTPVEPHWGAIRPFVINNVKDFSIQEHIPFDTIPGTPFYELNKYIYDVSKSLSDEDVKLAMHWDGDPMPPHRLKHINLIKRQLNPVGHWLAIGKKLNNQLKVDERTAMLTYLRISLSCADALIVGWYLKYEINLIRPQSYINKYIDESWNPTLVTPLFPEYPSGHSLISGACANTLIAIFSDSIKFVDDTQIKFGHQPRTFESITAAADECAKSRVLGGVHYIPAVENGVELGRKIAEYHHSKFNF